MLNFNSYFLFSDNSAVLVDFYKKVFDKAPDMADGDWAGWKLGSGFISISGHDKVKGKNQSPERMFFNLETEDVKGEFERIKKTGATVVKEPYLADEASGMWVATFADPDGNFFQLMSPWKG